MGLPITSNEYQDLKMITDSWGLVYGPVQSRRLGLSLGINLLGDQKLCSFDCLYCELGVTAVRMNQLKQESLFPPVDKIEEAARVKLRELSADSVKLDWITISGNGEPTLHPQFFECVEGLIKARSDLAPQTPIAVLTNGAHCDNRRVVQGLDLVDERIFKIDAGNENLLKQVNRPLVRANLSKLTSGARKLKDVVVQSLFVQGVADNTRLDYVEEWMEILGMVKPKKVQITTLARVPAVSGLKRVDEDTLYTIASRLKRKLQIECNVYP